LAERYFDRLSGKGVSLPVNCAAETGDQHAWHLFTILLPVCSADYRRDFIQRMADLGVSCSVHFIPLHMQPYWRDSLDLSVNNFPNSTERYNRTVSLPLYVGMSFEEVDYVVDCVVRVLNDL
jgi:dTDP-4-amino-4,6-dideoxygalactose transaminase